MRVRVRIVFFAFALLLATGARETAIGAEITPIELNCLQARRSIERGQVELSWTTRGLAGANTGRSLQKDTRGTVYFDGKLLRFDQTCAYDPDRAKVHGKSFREVSCFSDREHVFYSDEILPDGHTVALSVRPRASLGRELSMAFKYIDPRLIGMVLETTEGLIQHSLESVVGNADRRDTTVEDNVLNGAPCKQIQYTQLNGAKCRIWICPAKNFSAIKLQAEYGPSRDKYSYCDTVECSVVKNGPSGIWFPERYTYTQLHNGHLMIEERGEIKVVSLNANLPTTKFSLAGIGVPAGKRVHFPEAIKNRIMLWDGEKLMPLAKGSTVPPMPAPWTIKRILLLSISIVAGAVTVVVLAYRRRQRA